MCLVSARHSHDHKATVNPQHFHLHLDTQHVLRGFRVLGCLVSKLYGTLLVSLLAVHSIARAGKYAMGLPAVSTHPCLWYLEMICMIPGRQVECGDLASLCEEFL